MSRDSPEPPIANGGAWYPRYLSDLPIAMARGDERESRFNLVWRVHEHMFAYAPDTPDIESEAPRACWNWQTVQV